MIDFESKEWEKSNPKITLLEKELEKIEILLKDKNFKSNLWFDMIPMFLYINNEEGMAKLKNYYELAKLQLKYEIEDAYRKSLGKKSKMW